MAGSQDTTLCDSFTINLNLCTPFLSLCQSCKPFSVDQPNRSWPLNILGLNCEGLLTCGFFSQLILVLFSICGWESLNAEGWVYALIYAILYRGLEHPQTLVSAGVLEPIPCRYQGKTKFGGSQKLYSNFQLQREVSTPNPNIVQGSIVFSFFLPTWGPLNVARRIHTPVVWVQ